MLPGDSELGMPSASQFDFGAYISELGLSKVFSEFIDLVDTVCLEELSLDFLSASKTDRQTVLKKCKAKNFRLFSIIATRLIEFYYTRPDVLSRLDAGSVPPFPLGNHIPETDWSLLEPVFFTESLVRAVPNESDEG